MSMSFRFVCRLTLTLALFLIAGAARAQTTNWGWTGVVDNVWSTPGNWTNNNGSYPNTTNDVAIILATNLNNTSIDLGGPITIQSLIFSNAPQVGINIMNNVLSVAAGGRIAHRATAAGGNNLTWTVSSGVNLLGDVYIENMNMEGYGRALQISGQIASSVGTTTYLAGGSGKSPGYWGVTISGNNTNFLSTAIITNGPVQMSHANAFGTNATPIEVRTGGNLAFNMTGSKPVLITGTSTITASGNSTHSGSIVLTNNPAVTLDSFNGGNTRTLNLNGPISGTGNLSVFANNGGSSVTFGGTSANTFTGNVTITRDTLVLNKTAGLDAIPGGNMTIGDGDAANHVLQLNAANQINDNAIVRFGSLSTDTNGLFSCFRLNGQSETVGGLQSLGNSFGTVENNHLTTASTLTINSITNSSYAGTFRNGNTGILNVAKSGTGTFFMNGTATNSGPWTVNGGTLGGTGTIACAVTVNNGGSINPGTNTSVAGTMTITNDLVFAAGATLGIDLSSPTNRNPNATNDMIVGVQNLTFNGNAVNIGGLSGIEAGQPGDYWTIIRYTGTLSGTPPVRGTLPGNARPSKVITNAPGEIRIVVLASGLLVTIR